MDTLRSIGANPANPPRPPAGRRGVVGLALLVLSLAAVSQAATLTATLDQDTIRAGESALLSLIFENGQPQNLPSLPAVRGLQVQFTGQQQFGTRIINGQSSSTFTLTYQLTAAQPGEYVIPSVNAFVDGATLRAGPVRLRVLAAGANAPEAANQVQYAFLRLIVPKTNVYVGEVFAVETRLFYQRAENLQLQPLAAEGFTLGKNVETPRSQAQSGRVVYNTLGLRTTATATKQGALQLGPAECNLVVFIPQPRQRPRRGVDPLDDFFNDSVFGNQLVARPTKLTSEVIPIQVLALPGTGRPADFTGAVGDFSLSVTASPTNVAVGEPVVLKVRVAGHGALDGLRLPSLSGWRDFQTYPPNTRVETTDAQGIEGAKVFEQTVVPQSTETKELPAVSFSFFDPAQKTYRTLQQPPIPILVRPSAGLQPLAASAPAGGAGAGPAPAPEDIVPLKARPGVVSAWTPPLLYRPWFLGLQALPVTVCLAAFAWRKRREHLAGNPQLVRRQAVNRMVRQGLSELRRWAAANQRPEFFALMFRLLQEQLGERLNLPAAAITEAVVDEQLRERELSPAALATLHELFQACNQARYAPSAAGDELATLVPKVEAVRRELARMIL